MTEQTSGPLVSGDWWLRYEGSPVDGEAQYDFAFRAVSIPRRWNGWAVPEVTESVLLSLIDVLTADPDMFLIAASWDLDTARGVLTYVDDQSDEPITFARSEAGTYVLDLGWCFDVVTDTFAVSTLEA